jgi:hypothetical protein
VTVEPHKLTPEEHRERWLRRFVAEHGRLPGELSREHLAIVRAVNPVLARLALPARRLPGDLTPEQLAALRQNPLVQRAKAQRFG